MKSINRNLYLLILVLLFLTFILPQRVYAQEKEGYISDPQTLNLLISEIYKKPKPLLQQRLLKDEQPVPHMKCATFLIFQALTHPDWLNEENRFILYRPTTDWWKDDYYGEVTVLTYDTPEGHFKLHYTEEDTYGDAVFGSDGNPSTIPDYVIRFGSYFEQVWDHEINFLGYTPPPPDGTGGGDDLFDIYIIGTDSYGYTSIENGHPYIIVHNNYTGFDYNLDPEDPRYGNMKITAAHEFFHAIQYFYDDWVSMWWEENTAVWMEDEVFDYVDGYLNYLGCQFDDLNNNLRWDSGEDFYYLDGNISSTGRDQYVWFQRPHLSLDYTDAEHEYGGVMWAKYLSAMFGNDFIKDTFIIADYNTNALDAIQETLQDYDSSLDEAFSDFRVNVLTLDFFEEGEKYPLIYHARNYWDYPISSGWELEDLNHLSSRYIGLKGPAGEKKLVINVDGDDGSDFAFALVLFTDTGYEVRYIPIEDFNEQVGDIEVVSFGTEGFYKRTSLIVMNLSTYQNYRSVDVVAHLEGILQYELRLRGGINMVSLPINLPGATTSFDFLSNYFDSSESAYLLGYDPLNSQWQVSYLENGPKGTSFILDWQKSYLISVPQDMTFDLSGDPPVQTTIDLYPGHNVISSLISDAEELSPGKILESTDKDSGERVSASIRKFDHEQGKHKSGYWFFGKPAGENFAIVKGEGYIIDMVEGREGWSPTF